MRLIKAFLIFLVVFTGLANEADMNTLTIRTSSEEAKTYKIKKIKKTRLSADGGRVILIETYGKEKCVIPMDKIVNTPRPNYQGCTHCFTDDVEVESYYTQMFLNRRNPKISCDVTNGETVGFNFIGGTTINGESKLVSSGLVLESAVYSEGPFLHKEKKPNALERLLDGTADLLLDAAF
ncbi:hypothetical protein ABMA79_08005 [Halobacteriovorax sp. HFRX-2_2]|uniref:hypothetical protein n=1 Tax=unclassified Halobacteriovorax TaxID=2639665 RepID=UPI003724B216